MSYSLSCDGSISWLLRGARIKEKAYATATSAQTITSMSNGCCSKVSLELKLYQAFIFCVPIFFTLILLFLFYLFYLRRRRLRWPSIRTRNIPFSFHSEESDDSSRAELGLKKEVRELLPVIVFKESFSVKDPQCSVCLGDYQAEERLQQIPACGHTFHMDCIDHWLATHSTCPLCRQSLLVSGKAPSQLPVVQSQNEDGSSSPLNFEESVSQHEQCNDDSQLHGESLNAPGTGHDDEQETERFGVQVRTNDEL